MRHVFTSFYFPSSTHLANANLPAGRQDGEFPSFCFLGIQREYLGVAHFGSVPHHVYPKAIFGLQLLAWPERIAVVVSCYSPRMLDCIAARGHDSYRDAFG